MSKGMVPSIFYLYVEGYDFDVLFGASSVLDRTHYLEFEYHEQGNWENYISKMRSDSWMAKVSLAIGQERTSFGESLDVTLN